MAAAIEPNNRKLYLGVDVGGTKILAAVTRPSGRIVARSRRPTPRGGPAEETIEAIGATMDDALAESGARSRSSPRAESRRSTTSRPCWRSRRGASRG